MGNWQDLLSNFIAALPASLLALAAWMGARKNGEKIDSVHVVVNSQREEMVAEIATLKAQAVDLKGQVIDLKGEVVDLKTEIYRLNRSRTDE